MPSFINSKTFNNNLTEDLEAMGINIDIGEMARLSSQRLDEAHFGSNIESTKDLNEDENYETEDSEDNEEVEVTESDVREFLDKIVNTDFEDLSEEQYSEIVDLMNSIGDLDNEELSSYFEDVAELIERRPPSRMKIRTGATGKMKIRKRQSMSDYIKGKKYRRKNKAKIKKTRKRYSKSATGRRTARKAVMRNKRFSEDNENNYENDYSDLLGELEGIMYESNNGDDPKVDVVNRFGRIFKMLSEEIDDESVIDIMEDAYVKVRDLLEDDLTEEEFMEEAKPSMQVLSACLKHMESEKN